MIAILAALALFAAPAQAADVTRVGLGSQFEALVAGPQGAWTIVNRPRGYAVGHAAPGGGFRTTSVDGVLEAAAIGPDGQAWFASFLRKVYRADASGKVSTVAELPADGPSLDEYVAVGPDGTLWATTTNVRTLARVTLTGSVTLSPFAAPACRARWLITDLQRAADGTMWFAEAGCNRLVRVTPAGAWSAISLNGETPYDLAPDPTGGMWFTGEGVVGHVSANGSVTPLAVPARYDPALADLAVAADGTAWFTTGSCALGRVAPGGGLSFVSAPVRAQLIAADPSGALWLAGRTRLVHATPGELSRAGCDDEPPRATVSPRGRVSLAALRRRGLAIRVREPAEVTVYGSGDFWTRTTRGGTVRFRPPAARLRALARRLTAGRRAEFDYSVLVTDAEGNSDLISGTLRVTR